MYNFVCVLCHQIGPMSIIFMVLLDIYMRLGDKFVTMCFFVLFV